MVGPRAAQAVELRDGVKTRSAAFGSVVFGGVVLIGLLMFLGQRIRFFEDAHSRSVIVRSYIGPFPSSERILYATPSFVAAKAVWTEDVQHHFDEQIRPDSWLVVKSSAQTKIFHIHLVTRSGVEFTHYDSAGTKVSAGRSTELEFGAPSSSFPRWSWTELGQGVVYTDDFFLQRLDEMYAVALIRSATNGIAEVTNRLGTLKFGKLPYEPIGN